MDIAAGRRSTLMTNLSTASLMDKHYNNNQGRESSREGQSSCHCVCVRETERTGFLSFFAYIFHSYRQSDQFEVKNEDAR